MALLKFEDYYPNYRDMQNDSGFDLDDFKHCDVYAQNDEKVGSVHDILVDSQDGRFRYFVVDTGFWVFGKKVLMPVGMASIDYDAKRIYARGLTKEQVEHLPGFDDLEKVDYDYEEQVRGSYRPMADSSLSTTSAMSESTADMGITGTTATSGMDMAAVSGTTSGMGTTVPSAMDQSYDRDSYSYDRDPDLYNLRDADHQNLKLYEERLVADKHRQKTGEVVVGKRVDVETTRVAVPVERERVVIERTTPTGSSVVDPAMAQFGEGEVARVDVYEETPDIHKEAFVREEVQVRKVADREVVNVEDEIRREELDIDTQGNPVIDKQI